MDISLSLLAHSILTLRGTAQDIREYIVKVREVRKRSACYHSLRKAHAPRRTQIKKRGSRTNADPLQHMHMTTDKMYYGFIVAFDSGSETGSNQLTVWVAEKSDIDAVPLKRFGVAQLLNSLTGLARSPLLANLEDERKARKLREQMKSARPRLEAAYARRELWSLDRRWYDRNMLQAQSHAWTLQVRSCLPK